MREEEETVRCPISGISCDECGYRPSAITGDGCFLHDLIDTLYRIADALKEILGEES